MDLKPCANLKGMCGSGCSFSGEEQACPKYEPEGRLKIVYIRADRIDPRPGNRDIGDVTELAQSLKAEGMHTPMTVVPHIDGIEGRYTNVAGHRRLEAAKLAGLEEVPCIVRELGKADRIAMMLTENTQRKDMTALEEADALQQLRLELPGGTVAAVAKRTGFSETTVRRRMRLAELDSGKAKQAEERGATLRDFEKLYELKDPARRERCLEKLGTKEFDRTIQYELNREKDEHCRDKLVRSLEKKGAVRLTEEECRSRKDLTCEKAIHSWQLTTASIGPLARGEEWFYTVDGYSICVYKARKPEAEAETIPKTDAQIARDELEKLKEGVREHLVGLETELEQMDQDFLDLREKFIENFATHQRNREEIMEFAVRAMICGCWWSESRKEELGRWLGVDPDDREALGRAVRANPEKLLLLTAYCLMERDAGSWVTAQYNTTVSERVVMHQRPEKLDRLYEGLELLGYGMSGDEKKLQTGEVMHFKQAQRLVENFKAAKKDLDKRINA